MQMGDSLQALAAWALGLGPALAVGLPLLGAILGATGYAVARGAWRYAVVRKWRQRARRNASHGARPDA